MKIKQQIIFITFLLTILFAAVNQLNATNFTDHTFLITDINQQNYGNQQLWDLIQGNNTIGIQLHIIAEKRNVFIQNSTVALPSFLDKVNTIIENNPSKILPVFINFDGDVLLLDSLINESNLSSYIFYLPQGETWPSMEYLVQANRRIVFFIDGEFVNESRVLHNSKNYALQISAEKSLGNTSILTNNPNVNLELFLINKFENLPTEISPNISRVNLVPDYINYLLAKWKQYGKKPNFIFVGKEIFDFDFIVDQLNSFTWIKGQIKVSGKNLEKVYWKNSDVLVTGGNFSFPYRGGEEITLSPFAPGYQMTPKQIVVTGEMAIPENYFIMATPMELSEELTSKFNFNDVIENMLKPNQKFVGENYSFIEDIERGVVLRLPENASINLGNPEIYGLRNSSFTVSCFVKFTEILDFGDNAILGNYETGYRRGLHLILRSGYPYFGLWANDFISEKKLEPNIWYHLAWRYIVETGEQSIFLDGKFIGASDGHPPYSGTGDIHLGSALSSGASLRGYIDNLRTWSRPLGNEEINRLSLDEEILPSKLSIAENQSKLKFKNRLLIPGGFVTIILVFAALFIRYRKKRVVGSEAHATIRNENKILLFGEFKAINKDGENITELFTPKVKELFLFTLIQTLQNGIGANTYEILETLWPGISEKKGTNNRSVTLNKLRKILTQFNGIEIVSNNGHLQIQMDESFFCDYADAFTLCQLPQGLDAQQLITFYRLVQRGRFLKGTSWPWLDDIRGFTGNQVIDNLLKLASIHKKEGKLKEIEKVAQRILEYDDLNDEAIYLQIWAQQKANNSHLAKFNFTQFVKKYEANFGEPYPMNFAQFNQNFEHSF